MTLREILTGLIPDPLSSNTIDRLEVRIKQAIRELVPKEYEVKMGEKVAGHQGGVGVEAWNDCRREILRRVEKW